MGKLIDLGRADPAVMAALGEAPVEEAPSGGEEAGRKSKRGPHEVGRARRSRSLTLASAGWVAALEEAAARLEGVEKADVVVLAVARLMAELEGGARVWPGRRRRRPWMRTGEVWVELPWGPPGEDL